MRGNSDSPSELFQARSATFRGLAHIYEALTLLLGVSSPGFIAGGCQEDCQALSPIRGDDGALRKFSKLLRPQVVFLGLVDNNFSYCVQKKIIIKYI